MLEYISPIQSILREAGQCLSYCELPHETTI